MTTMGEKTAAFESAFASLHDCKYAVMVNSGSSANLLMIAALVYTGRLPRGSRVAVPAMSWSTTYAPLEQFGMQCVIVDVDDSLTIDALRIPLDVDCIFGVNLLGNPCDFDKMPAKPMLIEDNCEALGAEYNGKWAGTHGVMGSHSLFFSHHISTMEGGVITTDDEELWRALVMLRAHGWTRDLPEWERSFDSSFKFVLPGFSVRPTEVAAAIGLEQLRRLPAFIEQRRLNGAAYQRHVGHQRENGKSSYFGFAVIAEDGNRAELLARAEPEFEVRPVVAGNILRHPMAKWLNVEGAAAPYADYVHDCGFFVGNHHVPCGTSMQRLGELLKRKAA
jgi:CDP-6-deoxy-D-xylo-4-hexulose-3-dehydrase